MKEHCLPVSRAQFAREQMDAAGVTENIERLYAGLSSMFVLRRVDGERKQVRKATKEKGSSYHFHSTPPK
jgi:hypothetical protein